MTITKIVLTYYADFRKPPSLKFVKSKNILAREIAENIMEVIDSSLYGLNTIRSPINNPYIFADTSKIVQSGSITLVCYCVDGLDLNQQESKMRKKAENVAEQTATTANRILLNFKKRR